MNQRSKLAAALLALFLGFFGAHWYYLGDGKTGNSYVWMFLGSLVLTPVLIGWLGILVLAIACIFEGFRFLAMEPALFDLQYNNDNMRPF
jgi:TM2 domain-containing membrane protein YozV